MNRRSFILCILVFICIIGCNRIRKIPEPVLSHFREKKAILKKEILYFPVINSAKLSEDLIQDLDTLFMDGLLKDRRLIVRKEMRYRPTLAKTLLPYYGISIDQDLLKRAKAQGAQIILTAIIPPFQSEIKKKGIWPFRKERQALKIFMVLNMIDVFTGTYIASSVEEETLYLENDKESQMALSDERILKTFKRLTKRHLNALLKTLSEIPWQGRIIKVDDGDIIINGGSLVGHKRGMIFEVYPISDYILSSEGRSIPVLGDKLGEMVIRETGKISSICIPLRSKAGYDVGQIVRLKRE